MAGDDLSALAAKKTAAHKVTKTSAKSSKVSAKPKQRRTKAGSGKASAAAKRMVFADAYIANGGNATQAAITCGLSPASAGSTGQRMAKHAEVLARIAERRQILAKKYELTAESVIKSLAQAVHFDPRKLYREDGSLKPVTELDDDTAMALTGIEVSEDKDQGVVVGYTKKIKWLDKNTARDQAMKHLGQYEQDNKQRSPLEGISRDALKAIVERLGARGR